MKVCNKCQVEKSLNEFGVDKSKKSGKQSYCKLCQKEHRNNDSKVYPTCSEEYRKDYYKKNKTKLLEKQKLYKDNNRVAYREYQNEYRRNRRIVDVDFRLSELIRSNVHRIFKNINTPKETKTFDIIDYTPKELKEHIQSLFSSKMSWDNHGIVWEIDHIKPINWFIINKSSFINDDDLCRKANSLNNLQPLIKKINRTKGHSYHK
jgi:hypothetical protein